MINKDKLIKSTVAAFLSLTASHQVLAADNDTTNGVEKCYGVVKAGMNDCHTATSSCSGSATKDGQADAFVLMTKGLCEKLVGGQLQAPPEVKTTTE